MATTLNVFKNKKLRLAAALVLVCFVFFALGTFALAAQHAHHGCTGTHCSVCALLHAAHRLLKLLVGVLPCLLAGAAVYFSSIFWPAGILFAPARSLVRLKVQINN